MRDAGGHVLDIYDGYDTREAAAGDVERIDGGYRVTTYPSDADLASAAELEAQATAYRRKSMQPFQKLATAQPDTPFGKLEVTLADLGILAANFGPNGPIPQAEVEQAVAVLLGESAVDLVPEPAAVTILALGALMMLRRRPQAG